MQKVFITRRIPQKAEKYLSSKYAVSVWDSEDPPSQSELLKIASEFDGLLCMLTDQITEQFFHFAKKLKAISQMAVGTDNIDINTATIHRIPVGNTPDVLTEACADHTLALLLTVARRIPEAVDEVHSGIWRPWGPTVLCGEEVYKSTIGIIGFGRIGRAVAKRALGFSMRVLFTSNHKCHLNELSAEKVSLDELLRNSDYVSVHVPLTPKTRGLISRNEFEKMRKNAIFINTSRGSVVDSAALTWALKNQKILGAGLDVFDPEPIPKDHPLLTLPNVVITPHIASATHKTREKMAVIAAENLIAALEGKKMPYCVNPQVYQSPGK